MTGHNTDFARLPGEEKASYLEDEMKFVIGDMANRSLETVRDLLLYPLQLWLNVMIFRTLYKR